MFFAYFILILYLLYPPITDGSRIELDILPVGSPYRFELASNNSHYLDRDVLLGLVETVSSSISASIILQAKYDKLKIERGFNIYQNNNKQQNQTISREPIFRSYLLTPTFNRSYPFVRVLIASARGSYDVTLLNPFCATVTAINGRNIYENQACFISPKTGYCLVTIPVLKMVENKNKNQTTTKIELYLKVRCRN